eukprot:6198895-Pleurochrysis_carterae.AAC.1
MASPTVEVEAPARATASGADVDEERPLPSEEVREYYSAQAVAIERGLPVTNGETIIDGNPSQVDANTDRWVAARLHAEQIDEDDNGVSGDHHIVGQDDESRPEMLPEPETAILMDDAAADSESDDPPVLDLFCSMCSTCVCRRGVRVLLVASPQDSLYSTDIPGDNLRLGEVDGAIDTCECKIRQAWQTTDKPTFANVLRQK